MPRITTRILLLLLFAPIFAMAQNKYTQISLMGYAQDSNAKIYQIDDGGNAYVIINSRYAINFQGHLYDQHQAYDFSVVAKLAANGTAIWSRQVARVDGNDIIYDLQVDKDKNVYLSGAGSNILLDNGTVLPGGTFLLKLDKDGKTQWGVTPENPPGSTSMIGGPIAIADDGVYWSSIFYGQLKLQGRTINTNNPNGGSPDAFVAKVSAAGTVTGIYHDPARSSIIQLMVPASNGNAAVVVMRGNIQRNKVLLDKDCNVISEKPFITYGDFPQPLRPTANGYEMLTYVYNSQPNGPVNTGYFDVKFDKQLDLSGQTQLFPGIESGAGLPMTAGINYNNNGFFLTSYTDWNFDISNLTWQYFDGNTSNYLPPEKKVFGTGIYTRDFVKVVGDTVNMLMRHFDVSNPGNYTFYDKAYTTPTNLDESYFWVKYIYEDPDACRKVTATVVKNGIEGSQDVLVKLKLPTGCPAQEDIVVSTTLLNPASNQNDFVLPDKVTIKKGETEADLLIKVIDDGYMENTETFNITLTAAPTATNYIIPSANLSFSIDDDDNTPANHKFTVTYTPEITEGGTGNITVSLPPGIFLSEPLVFTFATDNSPYQATPTTDYTSLFSALTIPAGSNSFKVTINAFLDNFLEGDEFASGTLSAGLTTMGAFTTDNDKVRITIKDANNTPDNRVIDITPDNDILNEGTKNTYTFKLYQPSPDPLKTVLLANPLNITATLAQQVNLVTLSGSNITLSDGPSASVNLTLTYPDDKVIRADQLVALTPLADDAHLGAFKFRWKGSLINNMGITAVDNDALGASLALSPQALTIREGSTGSVIVQTENGITFDNDITINYTWDGADIANENRVAHKTGSLILPKGQSKVSLPLTVADDQLINLNNHRTVSLSALNNAGNPVNINPQNVVSVDIIDDDQTTLNVPTAFTPNGDGINDVWKILNLQFDSQCKVMVYNRSGTVVYSSVGYTTPWDGTTNGQPLPTGTYYYVIVFYGKTHSGNVTIIR